MAGETTRRVIAPFLRRPDQFLLAIALSLLEGIDVVSIGLTLATLSERLDLNPAQAGICASAGLFGLMIGAAVGGRLADIHGRRVVMIVTMVLMGMFSLATAFTWSFGTLLAARFVTGLGLGGLMPVILGMASDSATERFRSLAVSIYVASGSIGAVLGSLISLHPDWRMVYFVGGLGPMLLIPFVFLARVESAQARDAVPAAERSTSGILFGGSRLAGTLVIWAMVFLISLIVHGLINWLPVLLVQQGFAQDESKLAMVFFGIGGAGGNLAFGLLVDRGHIRLAYLTGFLGSIACILALAVGVATEPTYAVVLGLNFLIQGAQLVTLSLTPIFYPEAGRSTGIGAMVSVSRLGSVMGPLLAGLMLNAGMSPGSVLISMTPLCLACAALGIAFAAITRQRGGAATRRPAAAG